MNRPLIHLAPQAFLDPEGPITGIYPLHASNFASFMDAKCGGARSIQPAYVSRAGTGEGDIALAFAEIDAAYAPAMALRGSK